MTLRRPRPGSLRVIADAIYVDVPCGGCTHGFRVTVGNARSQPAVQCPHCSASIDLANETIKARVSAVESALWTSHHALQGAKRRQKRKDADGGDTPA